MKKIFDKERRTLEDELAENLIPALKTLLKVVRLEDAEQEYDQQLLKKLDEKRRIERELKEIRHSSSKKFEDIKGQKKRPMMMLKTPKKSEESKPRPEMKRILTPPTPPAIPSAFKKNNDNSSIRINLVDDDNKTNNRTISFHSLESMNKDLDDYQEDDWFRNDIEDDDNELSPVKNKDSTDEVL